jgi:hypothetical protein
VLTLAQETLLFSTGSGQIALLAESRSWHHVVVQLSQNKKLSFAEIVIDKHAFGPVKAKGQSVAAEILFGDCLTPLPVPLHLAKLVSVSEAHLTESQVAEIHSKGPTDLTLRTLPAEKSESVFIVPYLGFASYFRSSVQIEHLFKRLESVRSNDHFRSVFTALANLQKLNRLKPDQFWSRMVLAFKRCQPIIANRLYAYVSDFILPSYDPAEAAKIVYLLLSDQEIYFSFSYDAIAALLSHVIEKVDWDALAGLRLLDSLLITIRSGIEDRLIDLLFPLISKLLSVTTAEVSLRAFFNYAMAISDWHADESTDLLRAPVPTSELQTKFLFLFVSTVKLLPADNPLFSNAQLLDFILLFSDERAFLLIDLLAFYSKENQKYNQPSSLACFVFGRFSSERKVWGYVFSILAGAQPQPIFPKRLQIRRPAFVSVVIDMLSDLAMKAASAALNSEIKPETNLLAKVVRLLLTLPPPDLFLFIQPNCILLMHHLTHLGVCPMSFAPDSTFERKEKLWATFSLDHPTREQITGIVRLTTPQPISEPIVPENLGYDAEATRSTSFLYFPFDSEDTKWMTDVLTGSGLLKFFVAVVVSLPLKIFQIYSSDLSSAIPLCTKLISTFLHSN